METRAGGTGDGSPLGSLLKAVIEATGEDVVVFDGGGRVAYASPSAQALIATLGEAGAQAGQVVPRLLEQGGRRVPLQLGSRLLGEAIFLRSAGLANLAERERRAILETLQATGGRLSAAARRLGISRTTLWRRLKEYGVKHGG
jgi:Bacterial regulatory protein, Fis family